MNKIQEISTTLKKVEYVLKHYPESRNSDKKLYYLVLREFYGCDKLVEITRKEVPCPETVRRHRQKFQADGKYVAVSQIVNQRYENQNDYQQFFAG